jgi:predicted nucleic acid-binding protein
MSEAVGSLWDTSLLSRLRPSAPEMSHVMDRAIRGNPVKVASSAILEVVYGCQRAGNTDPRYRTHVAWLAKLTTDDTLRVVPLDGRAAFVAGGLRGHAPYAPGPRKGEKRTKAMRQLAWLLDIQIAATAFAHGLDVATANRRDFEQIAGLLEELYPAASPLRVGGDPVRA